MRPRAYLIRGMVAVVGAASVVVGIAGPAFAATCARSGSTLEINAAEEDISITRSGSNFSVTDDGFPLDCDGATVTNVDRVDVVGTSLGDLELDLSNGAFAPGDTAEASGTSEIEFVVDWDPCDICFVPSRLIVTGSSSANQYRFSEPNNFGDRDPQVNLNSDTDFDVTMEERLFVVVNAGGGDDIVSGAGNLLVSPQRLAYPGPMRIFGQGSEDQLTGGNSVDHFDGGSSDDVMSGGGNADRFIGSSGTDSASGGPGDDLMDQTEDLDGPTAFSGGSGSDEVRYLSRGDVPISITLDEKANDGEVGEGDNIGGDVEILTGSNGNDVLVANEIDNILKGGIGSDQLTGGGGIDEEIGSTGNDTFHQGAAPDGADVIVGDHGDDIVDYSQRTTKVAVSLDGAANDGGNSEGDNVSVENVLGGDGNDDLAGDALANQLDGNAGNDRISGGLESDVIDGGSGVDTADYAGRADPLNLTLDGVANDGAAAENDHIMENVENAAGGSGPDDIKGNSRANRIFGGSGEDKLTGGGDNDHLFGELGDDEEFGNNGNDVFHQGAADDGSDDVIGGGGRDSADYRKRTTSVDVTFNGIPDDGDSDENDDIAGDVEIGHGGDGGDKLRGDEAKNVFFGGAGPDSLRGEAGADRLFGNNGDDSLNGGQGTDVCSGGAGQDTVNNCE